MDGVIFKLIISSDEIYLIIYSCKSFYKFVVIFSVADGKAYVVATTECSLARAILNEDVVVCQEPYSQLLGGELVGYKLTEEVVCLRGYYAQEGDLLQLGIEERTLLAEHLAGCGVVLVVLLVDLHIELAVGVYVPYSHLLFEACDHLCVATCQHSESEARHSIGLRDALNHHKVGIGGKNRVAE